MELDGGMEGAKGVRGLYPFYDRSCSRCPSAACSRGRGGTPWPGWASAHGFRIQSFIN